MKWFLGFIALNVVLAIISVLRAQRGMEKKDTLPPPPTQTKE